MDEHITRVVVVDDTLRRNVVRVERGRVLQMRDRHNRVVQEGSSSEHVFEDRHLTNAIRRARRWMSRPRRSKSPPRHIRLAMAAYARARPDDFRKSMQEMTSNAVA
jgi:hypothetical protein